MKGCWGSLIGLRILLRSKNSYKFAVKWIIACCILHNILVNIPDDWRQYDGWWSPEEEEKHDEELLILSDEQIQRGLQKREHIKELVLGQRPLE